jgi:aryl-alcohol dehydrogenase-like predicted oxidoreductase
LEHVRLGGSGLPVSRLALGTANFGRRCDAAASRRIHDAAADAGITLLDTANAYDGAEEILGEILGRRRPQFILTSKVGGPVGPLPWEQGSSRKHILDAIDTSLRRLRCDYLDLYLLHLWDDSTPLEETLDAMTRVRDSGKVRYIGFSNFDGAQASAAMQISRQSGRAPLTCAQLKYNVLSREIEDDLLPLCQANGTGVTVFNPLAGGLLSGRYQRHSEPPATGRFGSDERGVRYRERYWHDGLFETVDALRPVAAEAGMSMSALAVRWVLENPQIASVIIGPSSAEHVDDAVSALVRDDLDPNLLSRYGALGGEVPEARGSK